MHTNSHASMRVAAGPPTAEPQIDALYVGALISVLLVLVCSVLHCTGVSTLISGACLLLGGASVAVPASDWTERHRSRIAASLLSHPTHPGDVSFRGLVSRSLGGVGPASRVHMVCVAERPPMPYDDNHLSSPYI